MKIQIILLYLLIIIGGTVWGINQLQQQDKPPVITKEITYLALGDSYTIGESVSELRSWPYQLMDALKMNNISVTEFEMVAQTGWRTDELLRSAKKTLKKEKFDLVSLLIGVNNEFQGQSHDTFEQEFIETLNYAIEHSEHGKEGVFVLSIPDYAYTPFGKGQKSISKRIDSYNAVCARISKDKGVAYYNITAISRNGIQSPNFVASDGLHPSEIQYKIWVNSIINEVIALLKQH